MTGCEGLHLIERSAGTPAGYSYNYQQVFSMPVDILLRDIALEEKRPQVADKTFEYAAWLC